MSIPKWPDFTMEQLTTNPHEGRVTWAVRTDTGRPGTPIFMRWVGIPVDADEETRRQIASDELWKVFREAHPNGCPAVH